MNLMAYMASRILWGHIRMNEEIFQKLAMDMVPDGRRPVGRPQERWMDGARKDLQHIRPDRSGKLEWICI